MSSRIRGEGRNSVQQGDWKYTKKRSIQDATPNNATRGGQGRSARQALLSERQKLMAIGGCIKFFDIQTRYVCILSNVPVGRNPSMRYNAAAP